MKMDIRKTGIKTKFADDRLAVDRVTGKSSVSHSTGRLTQPTNLIKNNVLIAEGKLLMISHSSRKTVKTK